MNFKKDELVKSPMNYIGGKFKVLPQLLERFPSKINMLYDVFGGGGSVSLNTKAEHIYYNDIVNYIGDMFSVLQQEDIITATKKIHKVIDTYDLSKNNLEGFNKLREDYNKGNKSWDMFYMLVCHSFNYQYRFNNKHEYNSSFGKNRSFYSETTEGKFIKFMDRLHKLDIVFDNKDFRDIDFSDADKNDLIYFDPPYLITTGNYNDGKRGFKGWSEKDEIDLLNLCDMLDKQGTRFALSNVFECKGKSNDILKKWSNNYNLAYINADYNNCNYQAKDKSKGNTIEVLITNYKY
ncbi:Dam family site-specific DNA-(adenine-N6)-methyltransferase [Clostridium sp.]|uniref:DNA adenine methylase n=1 Tax=Clostridium sp. TaxID=1506 RepID=UPI00290DFE0D|nr:Dam family site-specific DNA-(adenine-N6)-methyltransferase [Clostridium sp.]MDU3410015.1 Dam family site-specific DNA-(adenine-N6)-methyltransferase [Clostridium sp.]